MARLFADEDFPFPIVSELRILGHDVTTVQEIGKANQKWPDSEVFFYAIAEDRILLTRNRRDFHRLHLSFPAHPGIVACTADPDSPGSARRIHASLASTESTRGQFIRIYRPG